jgi:hypothetical protein
MSGRRRNGRRRNGRRRKDSSADGSSTPRSQKCRRRAAAAEAVGDAVVTRPIALPRRRAIDFLRHQGIEVGDDCSADQLFDAIEPVFWYALEFGIRVKLR